MAKLLQPRVWCSQRWCREGGEEEHQLGDGCSCDRHGDVVTGQPKRIQLTASAARMAPFACRACGQNARQMVEYPNLFFRCEPCAAANRWPEFRSPSLQTRRP